MKKILLLILCLWPFFMNAQITNEDFESYNAGLFDPQMNPAEWSTGFLGAPGESEITEEQAYSGTKSLKIVDSNAALANLVLLNSGSYDISYMSYVTPGTSHYLTFYSDNYVPGQVDFGSFIHGPDDFGNNILFSDYDQGNFQFNVPAIYGEWVENRIIFDFNSLLIEVYYDGNLTHSWSIEGIDLENGLKYIHFPNTCFNVGCTINAFYDDIRVVHTPAAPNDLALLEYTTPSEYSVVPPGLEQAFTLEGKVRNVGQNLLTDVSVAFDISDSNGSVFTSNSSSIPSFPNLTFETLNASNDFTPNNDETYEVSYMVSATEIDDVPANNVLNSESFTIAFDSTLYARDNGVFSESWEVNSFILFGNNYEFVNPSTITGINIATVGGTNGGNVRGYLYATNADGRPTSLMETTETINISNLGSLSNPEEHFINFSNPIDLPEGTYSFIIEALDDQAEFELGLSSSIYTPFTGWIKTEDWDPLSFFQLEGRVMAIRAILDAGSVITTNLFEVENNQIHLTIAPNPNSGLFSRPLRIC